MSAPSPNNTTPMSQRRQAAIMMHKIQTKTVEVAEIDAILKDWGLRVWEYLGLGREPVVQDADLFELDNHSLCSSDLRVKREELLAQIKQLNDELKALRAKRMQAKQDAEFAEEEVHVNAERKLAANARSYYTENPELFFADVILDQNLEAVSDVALFKSAEKIIWATPVFTQDIDPQYVPHMLDAWKIVVAALKRSDAKYNAYMEHEHVSST